jgi:hypothetical protein
MATVIAAGDSWRVFKGLFSAARPLGSFPKLGWPFGYGKKRAPTFAGARDSHYFFKAG